MVRVELKVESLPTKEDVKRFKEENPDVKIRVQKNGKIFIYLEETKSSK